MRYNLQLNRLLASLSAADLGRFSSQLELIDVSAYEILHESGCQVTYVYFPTTAIISLTHVMNDGFSAEIAVVGHEGLVGISSFMGGDSMTSRAVVLSAGKVIRLNSRFMIEAFEQSEILQHALLGYTQALITMMSQNSACNRHHSLHQRLSRWLLLNFDRLPINHLTITQEMIANMLGVGRKGVTEAASQLQKAGLIHYARGHITLTNRLGLEHRTCECYKVVKKEYERLLPTKVKNVA
ncbi:MAG: Crp/Fnr family transcriptional regulator [Candidatus Saccharibacteria bacterium]|nr:Crp/Fnr family transcriptional regulator [Moraxellaceae bacterium]